MRKCIKGTVMPKKITDLSFLKTTWPLFSIYQNLYKILSKCKTRFLLNVAISTIKEFCTLGSNPIINLVSQGRNCCKHCCSSRCQSTCLRWLGWTQEHKNHRGHTTVYPGLGRSVPYVQQLMIHILKSTQNQGLQQSV